ncbi:MAG: FAD-binding and (Fe-S)-binding domain-containing protein [Chloroflexota bacterium]|nr:FAD-binding and (Fe-S)-binding domain-containing protein [Chloroflexota bacterium]
MGKLALAQETWLREHFDGRFNADLMERKIYSHDVGVMPPLIKPLIGKSLADGVVQPRNEEEIVELVRWASQNRIPLIPRGKASSGYGGALPVKGGITVDFYRMHKVLSVDKENLTATVEPGLIWRNMERELAPHGLALRLYPSSAPSSTVGGWLAQGGFGFGSFEYRSFPENVISARVVLPSGEVREFSGYDLDLVSDAEGITGIITQITLRVRPLGEEVVIGGRFADAHQLAAAFKQVVQEQLPLWSVTFINPEMAHLKNQLPPNLGHSHPVDDPRPDLPEGYLAIFVFPASREWQVRERVEHIIARNSGELLSVELSAHEWDERFSIMQIKRLGPSLIPTEVVLPLENLGQALTDIEGSIHQPLSIEGMVSGGENPQVVLLGFIPHDERSLLFNMAFGLSLSVIQKAKKYGGRAYASGLYFAQEAEHILGPERVQRLKAFKREIDPQGIMNPGKILDNNLLGTFMSVAGAFEPLVRAVANLAKVPVGERPRRAGKRGIPDDVAWYAYACAQCGYCVDGCDQFYGRGWESQSPRGKWFFLKEYLSGRNGKMSQEQVNTFLACTTCEVCNVECPLELPIESSWLQMRGELVHNRQDDYMTFPPFEIMRASLCKEHNIWASYRKDRPNWAQVGIDTIPERAEICYFPGCTASYVEQDIAQSTACLLRKAGVEFTYLGEDEACCGIPMLVSGLWDTWEEIMRHNIAAMKKRGVKTVVTTCPACWLVWNQYYPEWAAKLGIDYPFETLHFSEILAEQIRSGDLVFDQPVDMRVTWHDSCHMGRAGGIYEPPREVLQAVPGLEFVEMEHNRDQAHCCGSVLSLVADPKVAERIGDIRLREADAVDAEAVVSTCPCCQVQLRVTAKKTGRDLPVVDLGSLVCQASGIPHPDPTEYALEMWATFESMINLMRPGPMSELMTELFPQMMDAMPMGMGGMMRAIGKMGPVGGAILVAMKPLFPILFPILMPGMMPKVMPDMLTAVGKRVPMPQHMKEQMPDLMPAAMDNLMPKMLPDIVPLISDPLVAYLRGQ